MRGGVWLGADVGGTNLVAALFNSAGTVLESVTFPTDPSPRPALARLVREARLLVARRRVRLRGAGLAVPGDIDHEAGRVRVSPNLPLWNGFAAGPTLARRLRVPVTVENDATAAGWGAYVTEAPRGTRHLLCVTLGTGVGGGLVLDGRVFRGATGTAGEFGHMVMNPRGPRCRCGNRGCVEAYAGTYGLLAASRRAGLRVRSVQELRAKARAGSRPAVRVFRDAYMNLGIALANVVNLLNLDAVILTGGIAHSGDLVLAPVRAAVRRYAFKGPARHVKIALARDKDHLGVIGAALLAQGRV